jgi:succinate-semialdehyde dehydrogenase/glutarate-semialdehyde dehydrogenase
MAVTSQTINPLTEELVRTFRSHTDAELAAMIAKAEDTFQNDWSQRSIVARKASVNKAASILCRDRDEFAKLVTLEMGKLFREAQAEVDLSADILDYYADHANKFLAPQKLLNLDPDNHDGRPRRWRICA